MLYGILQFIDINTAMLPEINTYHFLNLFSIYFLVLVQDFHFIVSENPTSPLKPRALLLSIHFF
jgi:hypothetical protein